MQNLKSNNPGFPTVDATNSYWLIENDTNMGFKWTFNRPSGARYALGLGYEFAFIIGNSFSAMFRSPGINELVVQPNHLLIRQGPMARFYCRW